MVAALEKQVMVMVGAVLVVLAAAICNVLDHGVLAAAVVIYC